MWLRSISFVSCFFFLTSAGAQLLSESQIFNRCYVQLTGHVVPLNHPVMKQIKAGTMKAAQACDALLDKAELDPGTGMLTSSDPEAGWVLNNFYNFHRTWFPTNTVEQIAGYTDETGFGTRDIYDSTEPGLAVTRAVFKKGGKYTEVLTDPMGVHALRSEDPKVRAYYGFTVNFPSRRIYGNNVNRDQNLFNFSSLDVPYYTSQAQTLMVVPKIEVGELVGIRSTTESFMVPNVQAGMPLAPQGETKGNNEPGLNYTFNLYQTLGGGILGTPIYLMMNLGHPIGQRMNGSTKVPRRWAQTNMSSFLCASLPALRESDVQRYVVGNSTAPFRNATSCVMCHASLDPMAYTARNAFLAASTYYIIQDAANPYAGHDKLANLLTTYRADFPSVSGWPSEPVANFQRQVPTGRLYFRSFSGQLVDQSVTGIGGLGQAMTQTDDFYQCAAKRYFEYFTGIEVALYDRQDPRYAALNKQLSAEAITDRLYVEKIAADLKKDLSVKNMIKTIIGSDYYRSAKFRP